VVSGGWKKMPAALKDMIRAAVSTGGGQPRILPGPFAYLDKTYVDLLGGIRESLAAVAHLPDLAKVVQVKGRHGEVGDEACLRSRVQVAFGGGVTLDDVDALRSLDVDIVDVGRQIVDAPLLDMRLDVVEARRAE
jgi:nicotinate-nucleotide pyrophosphorylase (carboxylating)